MSLRRFGRLVAQVMGTLPVEFRPYLDNLVVDVADEPHAELLRSAGLTEEEIAAGATLYGFFEPLEVPDSWGGEALDIGEQPHRIWIFKRPLEEDFPERKELLDEVRKTVIHELAHHFGYTERDIDRWTNLS
jgi:predicted Zn-dependent protease with MMP-like domain